MGVRCLAHRGPGEWGATQVVVEILNGLLVGDKDAEGVAVEVFVHAQGFIGIVGAIEPQGLAERKHALVHGPQFIRVADSQIEMKLLRDLRLRPRRPPATVARTQHSSVHSSCRSRLDAGAA